ncbi:hypothetical protein QBC40DRAFT_331534 [Triangularia verruculosa]|uniref:Uncharacterized protein n=1 Tax=Triangularia verruculosa TaxID=2587418 RepID=A0AAN6XDQ7_9PEZI|nr:hypothetical protein QBC40DRAFT_331534 [Triangularia verruculosa]
MPTNKSSGQRFARTTLLLHRIGELLQTRKQDLCNLCLTNKLFHAEFREWLYLYVDRNLHRISPDNTNLGLPKHLIVDGWDLDARRAQAKEAFNDTFGVWWKTSEFQEINQHVQNLIRRMPFLESFIWEKPFELDPKALKCPQRVCPALTTLRISHPWVSEPEYYDFDRVLHALYDSEIYLSDDSEEYLSDDDSPFEYGFGPRELDCFALGLSFSLFGQPEFYFFRNLQHLSLRGCFDCLEFSRKELVKLLLHCPNLGEFEIGLFSHAIAHDIRWTYDPEFAVEDFDMCDHRFENFVRFFDRLCDEYAEAGGQPLRLRTLGLYESMWVWKPDSLKKLTDLTYLEEARLNTETINGYVDRWISDLRIWRLLIDGYSRLQRLELNFDIFSPTNCPKLRHFIVPRYHESFHRFLCTFPEEIALSGKLSVLIEAEPNAVEEWDQHGSARLVGADDPRPTDALDLLPPPQSPFQLARMSWATQHGYLRDLAASNGHCLQGLVVHLDRPTKDRRPDGIETILKPLRDLSCLTQLWVIPKCRELLQPMLQQAVELANAIPSLRHLAIGWYLWEIVGRNDGNAELEVIRKTSSDWERGGNGLFFSHELIPKDGGLR